VTPPEEPDDPPLRPLMGPAFWAMLAFCALCILAGVAFAVLAPRLLGAPG